MCGAAYYEQHCTCIFSSLRLARCSQRDTDVYSPVLSAGWFHIRAGLLQEEIPISL